MVAISPSVKIWLKRLLDWALLLFFLPQAFLFCYYFTYFWGSWRSALAFSREVAAYGLTISWVSLPLVTLIYAAGVAAFSRRVRGLVIWILTLLVGVGWVLAWNWTVYPTFKLLRSLVPILICATLTSGYAIGCNLYRKGVQIEPDYE